MAIYEISDDTLKLLESTTYADSDIKERKDLQQLLKKQVDIISPKTLVIKEEFFNWDSNKRIDLLGIDKDANLVVIELKRTEDSGHAELQALRYAAMVSTMTFEGAVSNYEDFLIKEGIEKDARQSLLDFLDWESEEENEFAQDVRIVLASADFSNEIMSTVLWLNDNGLDIRCVRLKPYRDGNRVLIDIQQAIPLPEAEEYQIRVNQKSSMGKIARKNSGNLSSVTISIGDKVHESLGARWAIYCVVKALFESGVEPENISRAISGKTRVFRSFDNDLSESELREKIHEQQRLDRVKPNPGRWFYRDMSNQQPIDGKQPFKCNEKTHVLTNQWTMSNALRAIDDLIEAFPAHEIGYTITAQERS